MKTIVKGKGAGKIDELVHLASERGGYIVTRDSMNAKRISNRARQLGVDIYIPITYTDFIQCNHNAYRVSEVYIDDVDALLATISRVPIAAITVTQSDEIGANPIHKQQTPSKLSREEFLNSGAAERRL